MADCLFVLYVLFVCGYLYVAFAERFEKFRFEIYKAFLDMIQILAQERLCVMSIESMIFL